MELIILFIIIVVVLSGVGSKSKKGKTSFSDKIKELLQMQETKPGEDKARQGKSQEHKAQPYKPQPYKPQDHKKSEEEIFDLYRDSYSNPAKNGDNEDVVRRGETTHVCSNCGAKNIIPINSRVLYTCYFCREKLL